LAGVKGEGVLMKGRISMDAPVIRVLDTVANLLVLNILFVITCIPIVTVGAAWSALYTVTLKMVRGEEAYIAAGYMKGFRENFRQATIIWITALITFLAICQNFRILGMQSAWTVVLGVSCIFGIMILVYAFPLLARFDNTLRATLNNALLMAVRHFPVTVVILLVTVIPIIATFAGSRIVTFGIPFWAFFGFSLTALINSWFFRKIFAQYEAAAESR